VLNALKKQDGSPVDELDVLFDESFSKKMSTMLKRPISDADDLIDALENDSI